MVKFGWLHIRKIFVIAVRRNYVAIFIAMPIFPI